MPSMKPLNHLAVLVVFALAVGCKHTSQGGSDSDTSSGNGASVDVSHGKDGKTHIKSAGAGRSGNYGVALPPTSRTGKSDDHLYADNTTYAANTPAGTTVQNG